MELIKDLNKFVKQAKKPLIVVMGPTASGKTGISLKIAHEIDGEIISTDSRQIYKEMEIGTDAIPPEQQEGIPHHMLGISTPDKTLTLANYKDRVLKIIDEIYQRGQIPMLVGGTGLYISAIIEGYDVPRVEPNVKLRKKLQEEAKEHGKEYVFKQLEKIDPEEAARIHPNNLRYVIRAIEIAKSNGKKCDAKKGSHFDTFMVGVEWPREKLYERVNLRVDLQIKRGLTDEVQALLDKGYDQNLPSMSSLGVKEIVPYLKGEMPLEECIEVLKRGTRNYAKRQMTWFRRYDSVHWLSPKDL